MTSRGDVVMVRFPFVDGGRGKNRPALAVQNDRNNQKLSNTIVVMITGNVRLASTEPTQYLIDPATPEGRPSGLAHQSAVKCENLFTISQNDVIRTIGHLSASTMDHVDDCLKAALDLN